MIAALWICLLASQAGIAPPTAVAKMGQPTWQPRVGGSPLQLRPFDQLNESACDSRESVRIELSTIPKDAPQSARYFWLDLPDGNCVGAMLDRRSDGSLLLRYDADMDGDLTTSKSAESQEQIHEAEGGKSYTTHAIRLNEPVEGSGLPLLARFSRWDPAPDAMVVMSKAAVRRGTVLLDDRSLDVAVGGERHFYGLDYHSVWFDLDGDGQLDFESELSRERYRVGERFVNFGEHSYRFEVSDDGSTLSFERQPERLADRIELVVGEPAPDFEVEDLSGELQSLARYRGSFVLLDFWAIGCAPCIAELPQLVEARKEYDKLEILSIAPSPGKRILELAKKFNVDWPQIGRGYDGLAEIYRVNGWPSYFLIGPEGKLLSHRLRPDDLEHFLGEK